ncbi:MAG: phosphatase PAP2 family protein [Solirubrobacterales bacterium]|nr:phosphatase PAP2 family protein [Solirubrobacterales bacterium]
MTAGPTPLPRQLTLLAVASAIAVFLVYVLMVRTHWGQELDERTLLGGEVISHLRASQANRFLSFVSGGTLLLAMILVAVVAFLRGRPRMALIAAASVGVAVLSTEILKLIVLERPPLVPSGLAGGGNSYPSGHTTIGMSVCLAALLVVPVRLRIATALAAGAIGGAFGVAVIAAEWHRPSDAVGAYFVCLAIAAVAAIAIRRWPDRDPRARGRERIPRPVSIGSTELALFGMGAALGLVFVLAAISSRGIPLFSAGTAFLLSSAALVVLSFACALALAFAMNDADRAT